MTELSLSQGLQAQAHIHAGRKYRWLPFWLLLPAMLVLLVMQVLPTIYSIYLSTTRVRAGEFMYVEFQNFQRLLESRVFRESLSMTALYAFFYIVFTVGLGMIAALLLNRRVKYTGLYLVVIFFPWVISDVVAGTMWRWLFQPSYGLMQFWINDTLPFLGDALYTNVHGARFIVIAAGVWRGLAFTTLLALGALQTVPQEILESAALDGANRFQRFFRIILPNIRSVILVMVLLTSIQAINSLGLIFSITKGGPGKATATVAYILYETAWTNGDFGRGAAASVMMFFINLTLTVFYLRLIGRRRD